MAKENWQRTNARAAPAGSTGLDERDDDASLPFGNRSAWIVGGFLLAVVVYMVLFFLVPNHQHWPLMLLLPDEIVRSWFRGERISVLDRVPVLLRAGLILTAAFLVGSLLLDALRVRDRLTRLERFVFATGAGLNGISLWTLAAGLAGWLHNPWLMNGPLAAFSLIGIARGVQRRGRNTTIPAPSLAQTSWLERWGAWLGLPFAATIVLGGMLPPWQFDVREYHLQVPKEWAERGRIDFLPHNVYGNMPLGAEMPALLGATMFSGERNWWWGALVGKTVIVAHAPLTALLLLAAGRRLFSPAAGVVAGLGYLSTPWVAHVSMAGLIDGAVAFYFAAAVFAFLLWRDETTAPRPVGMLLLSGFLAGAATACKYPGAVFVVIPLAVAALWVRPATLKQNDGDAPRKMFLLRRCRTATVFLLAAFTGCGLWFAKNGALTGNPTYPLLSTIFPSESRTPELVERWGQAHGVPRDAAGRSFSIGQLATSLALIGWKSDWLHPLCLPFVIAAIFARRWRSSTLPLALLIVFVTAVWWFCTHRIDRFWVPVLPVVALLAGVGATWTAAAWWRATVEPLLVAGLLLCLVVTAWHHGPPQALLGDTRFFVALDELRTAPPRVNPVHLYLNGQREAGCRVLLVGDAQPFDLEVPTIYSTCFDPCVFEQLLSGKSPVERRAALRQLGITHVLINWMEIDRYLSPGNYGYTKFVTPELVHEELVSRQRLLRPIKIADANSEVVEVFEVVE